MLIFYFQKIGVEILVDEGKKKKKKISEDGHCNEILILKQQNKIWDGEIGRQYGLN